MSSYSVRIFLALIIDGQRSLVFPYSTVNGGARDISPLAFSRSALWPKIPARKNFITTMTKVAKIPMEQGVRGVAPFVLVLISLLLLLVAFPPVRAGASGVVRVGHASCPDSISVRSAGPTRSAGTRRGP